METINNYKELENSLRANNITMILDEGFRVVNLYKDHIEKLEGDIVECGVWNGGMSIYLSHLHPNKTIWVCDSYCGFEPLDKATHKYERERHVHTYVNIEQGSIIAPLENVQNNFRRYGLSESIEKSRIKFLKGFVSETLPTSGIEKIALLRIDVDGYSPTLDVLENLYDKVVEGGLIIFDDSNLYESYDAIKAFFRQRGMQIFLRHPMNDSETIDIEKHFTRSNNCYIIKK
jgi:O-methyltransferase